MKRKREIGPPLSAFAARRQAAELAARQQVQEVQPAHTVPDPSAGTHSSVDLSPDLSEADDQRETNRFEVLGSLEVHASRSKNVEEAETLVLFRAKTRKTEDGTMLGLARCEAVAIQGICTLTVLGGSVEILGAQLVDGDSVPLASSRSGGNLVVRATSDEPLSTSFFEAKEEVVATLLFQDDPHERNLGSTLDQYPVTKSCLPAEIVFKSPKLNGIMIPEQWQDAADCCQSSGCFIAVGAKGTGKSTFLRYMLNRNITSGPAVSGVKYLDLDPGQPEFNTPGQLSLTHHTRAALCSASAYSPLSTILRSHWIGETSPKEDPDHYLACVDNLIAAAQSHQDPSEPILVNTPGWIKGTGLELLHAIIARLSHHFESTTVFTLGSVEVEGHSLPAQPNNAISTPSSTAAQQQQQQQQQQPSTSAADLRTINLLSYLHRSESQSFQWHPHLTQSSLRLPFSAFDLFLMRESLALHDIPFAINGTLIAILSVDAEYLKHFQLLSHTRVGHTGEGRVEGGPDVTPRPERGSRESQDVSQPAPLSVLDTTELDPQYSCSLGLGLVHGLDLLISSLYLVTPIDPSRLGQDRRLVLATGSIELPSQVLVHQRNARGKQSLRNLAGQSSELPYLSDQPGEGIGWQSWHVRRNIGRRIRN